MYSAPDGHNIDYMKMSKDLGLHKDSFKLRSHSSKQQQNLQLLKDHFKASNTTERNRKVYETVVDSFGGKLNLDKIQ